MIIRVPRELGRPCLLHRSMPVGAPAYQLQADPVASCPGLRGTNQGRNRWYRRVRETKRAERVGRESERLIVPLSRGNYPEGPRGGKETPSH